MSNKLKTLSAKELEHFISKAVSDYLNEECQCKVSNFDTPYIDTELPVDAHNKRNLKFEATVWYEEKNPTG